MSFVTSERANKNLICRTLKNKNSPVTKTVIGKINKNKLNMSSRGSDGEVRYKY